MIFTCIYFSDGKLDVVVPSFVHYLEALEGSDGDKIPGKVSISIFILGYESDLIRSTTTFYQVGLHSTNQRCMQVLSYMILTRMV